MPAASRKLRSPAVLYNMVKKHEGTNSDLTLEGTEVVERV
jgi:hypothetical protein